MWVRFRHQFADGGFENEGWEWDWLGAMTHETAEAYVKEELVPSLKEEYAWSEHYRGVEWVLEEHAPKDVLLGKLTLARVRFKNLQARIESYEKELEENHEVT